jgi:hypothetical protein
VLWTELRVLIVDTGRVWWGLLPMIMGVYLLGWLGSELTLRIAVILGDISPWLTLILFEFSFVCTLAAAIVILTLAGRELGIRQLLPEDEREIDDRDTSIPRRGWSCDLRLPAGRSEAPTWDRCQWGRSAPA